MRNDSDYLDYVLPSQRLTGTRAKILERLDEIILSLIGLRQFISQQGPESPARSRTMRTLHLMLGVNASYPFSDKLTGTLYVVNGYWHLADANGVPSSGVQVAYRATPEITVKQTMLLGPHQSNTAFQFWRFLSDTIVERRMARLVVAGEFDFATENVAPGGLGGDGRAWWVAAQAPIRWNVRGPWSVAVRPEVARDSSGRWTLAEQTVKAFTTTLEYKAPDKWTDTILRLEHRIDNSTGRQGGFFDEFETSPGTIALRPTQHLVIVAAIFTFDSPAQR